jgi:predicted GH43/DUF377 family glycosyl hydrolase
MWYSSSGHIGYATADEPTAWSKEPSNPVLSGDSGQWDDKVYNAVVIRSDAMYQMWYTGESRSGIEQTGYATSSDGINWTRHPNNPVLRVGESGEWDSGAANASSVIYTDGEYQMWYTGADGSDPAHIGYATSPDGVTWKKHMDNPVLKAGPDGSDSFRVWVPRVMKDGDTYRMWYSTRSGRGFHFLCYAEGLSTNVVRQDETQPSDYDLAQNYPNPFNPLTTIEFSLPVTEFVKLAIYDLSGREATTLVDQRLNAGLHSVTFDGTDLSSGVYFYRLQAANKILTRKLMMVK